MAGIILLGWLGGGSEGGNTDVLGHVFGFASGLSAGILVGAMQKKATRGHEARVSGPERPTAATSNTEE
jgi:membrane associated rhomboid family serine protease